MNTIEALGKLPGLESAKKVVMGLARGSAVQAVLFYGLEGSGKRQLADVLAKSWLCRHRGEDGACGECQACAAFDRQRSVDLLVLRPGGASRIIRLGAIIETGQKEDDQDWPVKAQTFLRTPPLTSGAKIVVIEDAERLNDRASNSLLKILEEPPPYGRFILLTQSVGEIFPTILSRCVAVACEVPGELAGFEDWALQVAGGAPGRAQELQEFSAIYKPIYDFAQDLPSRDRREALVAAETFAALADALQDTRKMAARAADAEALEVLSRAYRHAAGARPEALQAMAEAHRRIIGNANAGSVFDALFTVALG